MSETLSRSSPHTGTVLPEGAPFWIVDGKAYDLTGWMALHPGGATWFKTTQGRDISALLHTYHRDPLKLRKILARYEIEGFTERDVLPKMGIPPFLLAPDFDASVDLPRLDFRDSGSLLAAIRLRVNARLSKAALRRYDRLFDVVTWCLGLLHVAALGLMVTGTLAWWACVLIMVVTRTALAGAGHYHLHRKWNDRARFTFPIGKALFDINYVGTSLIGTDGHVLLHHPYLGSGADVKKTFFDRMLRLHPVLRIPGYTLHKFGICLLGLPLRAREIGKFEHPRTGPARDGGLRGLIGFLRGGPSSSSRSGSGSGSGSGAEAASGAETEAASGAAAGSRAETEAAPTRKAGEAIRADFWTMRVWMVIEFALCAATGYIVPWIIQFVITLWFNTFLVVASHDFEEAAGDDELDVIPLPVRDDWAARQICLSYDLSLVGNRWIDLWLSAGLSPHRVHHVLPFQGSGFANLVSESAVREACAEVGITWERPRNLIFNRFPVVIKHYLLAPVMAGPPPMGPPVPGMPGMPGMPPLPGGPMPGGPMPGPMPDGRLPGGPLPGGPLPGVSPPGPMPGGPPPLGVPSLGPPPAGVRPSGPPPLDGARPGGPPLGDQQPGVPPPLGGPPPGGPPLGGPPPGGPPPGGPRPNGGPPGPGGPPPFGPPPPGALPPGPLLPGAPLGAVPPPPGPPGPPRLGRPRITIGGQLVELVRYSLDGWRGVGV